MWDPLGTEEVTQNLKDAGCAPEMVKQFFALAERGADRERMALLKKHRAELLDEVHAGQDRIECLDYLIYQIQKRQNESKKGESLQ